MSVTFSIPERASSQFAMIHPIWVRFFCTQNGQTHANHLAVSQFFGEGISYESLMGTGVISATEQVIGLFPLLLKQAFALENFKFAYIDGPTLDIL